MNYALKQFFARSLAVTSTGPVSYEFCEYVLEHQKAQPAVVLVLKCLKRRGHSLKSHLTNWESWESNLGLLGTRGVTYPLHHGGSFQFYKGIIGK